MLTAHGLAAQRRRHKNGYDMDSDSGLFQPIAFRIPNLREKAIRFLQDVDSFLSSAWDSFGSD